MGGNACDCCGFPACFVEVACQVLRDMQAQSVLIEWQTVLAEALGERSE